MQQLPPALEAYTRFLLNDGASEAPTLKAPPTMDEVQLDAAAADPDDPLLDTAPRTLNLKADLAIRVALATEGCSPADLMLLVGQVTGVPVQVDWVSFDLANVDIDTPVAAPKGWQSARELVDSTAAALGAEIREEKTLVILTLSDDTFDQTLAKLHDLQDFGDGRDSATQVLREFLQDPESDPEQPWHAANSREDQQLAALAVESLRRMRGLEPKVDDRRLSRWARSSETEDIGWPLLEGGDAGPQLDAPINLAGYLWHTSRRNHVSCLVNWYDANRRGAAPKRLILPHNEADAAKTLTRLLSEYRLQVRRVDAQHWWIGNEATYDRLPMVLWTEPLGESRDALIGQLKSIMSREGNDGIRIALDDQSDRALLLLPRYIATQLPKIKAAIAAR